MSLNPQVEALLNFFAQMPPFDSATLTPETMRATSDTPMQLGPPPQVARVQDISIALPGRTLAARLYVPEDTGQNSSLTVFYHGGGWVIGTLDTHDDTCRSLARASGSAVLSVGYRLAPEAQFPVPLDDCYEAVVWAHDNAATLGVDSTRLAVAGDSAGGNLAAAVAIRARDEDGPAIVHQLLLYPVTDADFSRASYVENGGGNFFLSTEMMRWFWKHYVGDCSVPPPYAAVLRQERLEGLPPATILLAQYDPLRDEGLAYAEALKAAGVPVQLEIATGMIHGFFSMFQAVPDAQPYIDRAGARLRAAFS